MSAQKAISDLRCSNLSHQESLQRLLAAQSKLDAAIKSLESIRKRNDLVSEFHRRTRTYQITKDQAEGRSILLRWILQQIPLIELELNQFKVAKNIEVQQRSKRSCTDESDEERVSKRQRKEGEISDRRTHASVAKKLESRPKRSCHTPVYELRSSKQPKCKSQNQYLFPHGTPNAVDPASTGEPLSIQTITIRSSDAPRVGRASARSIHHPALEKTKSEVKSLAKVVLGGNARVMKRGRGSAKSSNLSALSHPTGSNK